MCELIESLVLSFQGSDVAQPQEDIMKFLHTMIRVKDIDASLKFYTELLNMALDKKKKA